MPKNETWTQEMEEFRAKTEAYDKQQKEIKDLKLELNEDELIPEPEYPKRPHDPLEPEAPVAS